MIIKHIYAKSIFYDWIGVQGKRLELNDTAEISDTMDADSRLQNAIANSWLEVVSYNVDAGFVMQGELGLKSRRTPVVTVQDETSTPILTIDPIDIDLGEKEAMYVKAIVLANKTDEGDRSVQVIEGAFYRATSGDVTKMGTTKKPVDEKSDGAWGGADFALDTGNQRIQIVFVGKAATEISIQGVVSHFIFALP